VDPAAYRELEDLAALREVGRVVGKLNKQLPKRRFILMGPGRWGSRGDIKLGVSVTYSEINNTAMLVEIARKEGNYVPDLSFGTHFFQDLVEASIRYLPLYPDEPDNVFNQDFLLHAPNLLPELLPEHARLAGTVRVIDVPRASGGLVLRVLMNGDEDRAVAVLSAPAALSEVAHGRRREAEARDFHWRWRLHISERVAAQLDSERFGHVDAESLRIIHAHLPQFCEYPVILHVLRRGTDAHHMADAIDRLDHGIVHLVFDHVAHKCAVDLDEIHRQVFEITERRHAAAKIIQGEAAAE